MREALVRQLSYLSWTLDVISIIREIVVGLLFAYWLQLEIKTEIQPAHEIKLQ